MKFLTPIWVPLVSSLPTPENPGRVAFNVSDGKMYFDTGLAWVPFSTADDVAAVQSDVDAIEVVLAAYGDVVTHDAAEFATAAHTHAQSDVTNLVSDLAGKAATAHTHAQGDITGLTSALALLAPLLVPPTLTAVNYTVLVTDRIVIATATGITLMLPASPTTGHVVTIKASTGTTYVDGNGKLIDRYPSVGLRQDEAVTLIYDGTAWRIT